MRKKLGAVDRYRYVESLIPPAGYGSLAAVSVAYDGCPVAMWTIEPETERVHGRPTPDDARYALTRYMHGVAQPTMTTLVHAAPPEFPTIQLLPGGDWLVVGMRCAWVPEGPEQNALVVAADGAIRRRGTLGDGIEHLLVDGEGAIWVGYFDEGIFGNYGWGGPGPEPLGSAGIVKWSSEFERVWEHEPTSEYMLADCYTLNVAEDDVWACPFVEFPLVRIRGEVTQHWPTRGVAGPRGILVAGGVFALLGSYDSRSLMMIGARDDATRTRRRSLVMPDGSEPPPGTLVCRTSVANLFIGNDWFTFDLSESRWRP